MAIEIGSQDIKRIRNKLNLSQEDFALLFGFASATSVSNIETGFRKAGPTLIIMLRFLDSLNSTEAKKFLLKLRQQEGQIDSKNRARP